MIVRATKDIAQGEEILAPYVIADADNAVTQQQYEKIWGFTCGCHICTLEAKTPPEQRKERQAAIAEAKEFFQNNSPASPTKASITRAEQLYEKTEKTYDAEVFKDSPRLGLVDLGVWMCRAYHTTNAPKKLTAAAETVLRNLGFILQIDGQSLSTKRGFCHLEGSAIEAAMRAAHAYRGQGKKELGDEFEEFGRELYVTLHGETRGFRENYNATSED